MTGIFPPGWSVSIVMINDDSRYGRVHLVSFRRPASCLFPISPYSVRVLCPDVIHHSPLHCHSLSGLYVVSSRPPSSPLFSCFSSLVRARPGQAQKCCKISHFLFPVPLRIRQRADKSQLQPLYIGTIRIHTIDTNVSPSFPHQITLGPSHPHLPRDLA